jgi:hypothetical protein
MSEDRDYPPSEAEWSFDELASERAQKLEKAPCFDDIVCKIRQSLKVGITEASARSYDHLDRDTRAVIQFRVDPDLYDLFFNSRTGYRAQYWHSLERGVSGNAFLLANLLSELCDSEWPARDDWKLTRDLAMRSLVCAGAKVWVDESRDIYRANFIESPRLRVRKWQSNDPYPHERACAPRPACDRCWLDLKGCFVDGGAIRSSKDPFARACQINETGWTW